MKKNKRKVLLKSVRKAIREDIKQNLLAQLKEVAEKLGQTNKKFDKEIKKGSEQLAKKLSKGLKIKEVALLETDNQPVIQVSSTAVAEQKPVNSADVKKASANKSKAKPKKVPAETV